MTTLLGEPSDDEDWEYEYDPTETEVFLVDVDMTTTNRSIKAASATRSKRLLQAPEKPTPKPRSKVTAGAKKKGKSQPALEQNTENSRGAEQDLVDEDPEGDEDNIQVLDLHTNNPLVSHNGTLYSCTWVDMIGTNMFFTEHQETPLFDPELTTDDYDMVGMSRIKLVGQQTKLIPNKRPLETAEEVAEGRAMRPGESLGTIRTTNPKTNMDIRKQANFLEQLMNVKKNRGEMDSVRLVANDRTVKALEKGKFSIDSRHQRDEIDKLNFRVVKGDKEAYDRLEEMYSARENVESDEDIIEITSRPLTIEDSTRTNRSRDATFENG